MTGGVSLGHCLVTGAAGFLGRNLVRALLARGHPVRALVHQAPLELSHERLHSLKGDVQDAPAMLKACDGIDTVFHTAARISLLGGASATREYRESAEAINVGGTRNTLRACQRQGVKRLVYTSSVDVCFDGSPMPSMDEGLPYVARPKSVYAQTKAAAEALVLQANGRSGLLTCAIRPDGIYGAEPNEMLDRFLTQLVAGRIMAVIGDGESLQDNSHIDNLVHGELLAAEQLTPGGVACGKAYFISDDEPANSFEFFRPLIEGLGYRFPTRKLPVGLLMPILTLWETLHFRLGISAPLMSPHELDKVSVTHFASIQAAQRDLGYQPIKSVAQAMEECLPYARRWVADHERRSEKPRQ